MSPQGFYPLRQDLGMVSCMESPSSLKCEKSPRDYSSGFLLDISVYISQNNHGRRCPNVQSSEPSLLCFTRRAAELVSKHRPAPLPPTFPKHSRSSLPQRNETELQGLQDYQDPVPSRTVTTFNSASAPLAAWRNNKMFCWAHGSSLCPPAMAGGMASWPTAKYCTRTSLNWVYLSFFTEIILAEVFPHPYHYYFILTNSTLRSN